MSPVNVKGRRKVINFYLYPICISNQQILLQLCVELQSELAQAVAPLPTGFSAADACTFFLSKTTQNVPKSLPLLPLCFGSAIVVKPIGGDGFSCGSPPKVLKSNIQQPSASIALAFCFNCSWLNVETFFSSIHALNSRLTHIFLSFQLSQLLGLVEK